MLVVHRARWRTAATERGMLVMGVLVVRTSWVAWKKKSELKLTRK